MNKPYIFVSCGQYTDEEKSLGRSIVQIVKNITEMEAFFAEEVHDLNGLDANILQSLHECSAFITVIHPRGTITRPDGSKLTRASVWIEQEIAIATYIQHIEERSLPVLAFIHRSVGREGLRDLIHLNPIPFSDATEVLTALPGLLDPWKQLKPIGIHIELQSTSPTQRDGHPIGQLMLNVVNDSNTLFSSFNGLVRLPAGVLKHWQATHMGEER